MGDCPPSEDELRAVYRAVPTLAVDDLVRCGDAPDAIQRTTDEVKADLIVVDTHGRSELDRLLCGSVAESVLQRSSRPVLVVRQTDVSRAEKPIRIFLHPTDFCRTTRATRLAVHRSGRRARARRGSVRRFIKTPSAAADVLGADGPPPHVK
jgi:hypothetical protein